MYSLAVVGQNPTARTLVLASQKTGIDDIQWYADEDPQTPQPAYVLGANLTRIIAAVGRDAPLRELGHMPDRQQVRLASSAFLISELPLGQFSEQRYGAPLINIEANHWLEMLALPTQAQPKPDLRTLEQQHAVIADCATPKSQTPSASHKLFHAALPLSSQQSRVNITWLGQRQCAWQFSTRNNTHYFFATPLDQPLEHEQWHPMLRDAIVAAIPLKTFNALQTTVLEHWHEGSLVHLGEACYTPNPFLFESAACGLEDAWVLSRMLENYEEDIDDGLAEYAKFRRPRAQKIARHAVQTARRLSNPHRSRRFLGHLNHALSTRFLPEIAMQRVDWFFGYDCIRGFR